MNLSRKEFLMQGLVSLGEALLNPAGHAGRDAGTPSPLRPPGFLPERAGVCTDCDRCASACLQGIVGKRSGIDGPVLDPRECGCDFCFRCIHACPHGVLVPPGEGSPVRLGVAVSCNDRCLAQRGGCFSCLESCPEEAISIELGRGIRIDAEKCTGCGSCVAICPVSPKALVVTAG